MPPKKVRASPSYIRHQRERRHFGSALSSYHSMRQRKYEDRVYAYTPEPTPQELRELKEEVLQHNDGARMLGERAWVKLWNEMWDAQKEARLGRGDDALEPVGRGDWVEREEEYAGVVVTDGNRRGRDERLARQMEALSMSRARYGTAARSASQTGEEVERTTVGAAKDEGLLLDLSDAVSEPASKGSSIDLEREIFGDSETVLESKRDPFGCLLGSMRR